MKLVSVTIDGHRLESAADATILAAAQRAGIEIPTLCFCDALGPYSACRVCVVEVKGADRLLPACGTRVADGIEVVTDSPLLADIRRTLVELILSDHEKDCLACAKWGGCKLQALAKQLGVTRNALSHQRIGRAVRTVPVGRAVGAARPADAIVRDRSACILCGNCVRVCREVQKVSALALEGRGFAMRVATPFDLPLAETPCVECKQCVRVCPTGAMANESINHQP
ncbi:MAG: 2Fe-2S iron-sulfur cluster binding domain-containing protein [Planctomycetes bacterium]|nr:2Fe-2S iron-sulfur cluster binding domain-containing protein [Planctomycetota bacterium]